MVDDVIIRNKSQLKELSYFLKSKNPDFLAFDTETNGLHFFKNVIIGFSFSISPSQGWYIPLLEWEPDKESLKIRSVDKVKREVFLTGRFKDVWRTDTYYAEDVTSNEYKPPSFIVEFFKDTVAKHPRLLMHNAPFDVNMVAYNFDVDICNNLYCDTRLLKHFIDESTRTGLKETAKLWAKELNFDAEKDANKEQVEMNDSIIRNGGKKGWVWRGNPELVGIYAKKDTDLTFGVFEVALQKLREQYSEKHEKLFFQDEIMPLCREVVIPMQYGGVRVDVNYFIELKQEIETLIDRFEDEAIKEIGLKNLEGFSIGKSLDDVASKGKTLAKIIEIENLTHPTLTTKGITKNSLAKGAVKKAFEKDPHWLWDHILNGAPIQYSDEKLKKLKWAIYRESEGRRYHFNLRSAAHLRWLFFDKLRIGNKADFPQTASGTPENPIPSVDANNLKEHYLPKFHWVEKIQTFKKLSDLLSNYIGKPILLHNSGWLHMNFDQAGTSSGRFSCRGGFNLQTLHRGEDASHCSQCESQNLKTETEGKLLLHKTCNDCEFVEKNIIKYSVIKKGFIAPDGYKIVNADYAQLEPRIFSEVSSEQKLKEVFLKNLDFYSKIYCDMENTTRYSADPKSSKFLKSVNPELRHQVKQVALAIPYGARGSKVAQLLNLRRNIVDKETGETISIPDVKKGVSWMYRYLNTYRELHKYMEKSEISAYNNGYVETMFGRRKHFKYASAIHKVITRCGIDKDQFMDTAKKDLKTRFTKSGLDNRGLVELCEHFKMPMGKIEAMGLWGYFHYLYKHELDIAKNHPIQGLAAHITNRAMLEVQRMLKTNNIQGYVICQVHDEITLCVPEKDSKKASELLKLAMENNEFAKQLDVPMSADPVICNNFYEGK